MHTAKLDKRFKDAGHQAAKALGVSIKAQMFNPRSIYGSRQRHVSVYRLTDGRELGVVATNRAFAAAVAESPDWSNDIYDSEQGQIAIADAFGLEWDFEEFMEM